MADLQRTITEGDDAGVLSIAAQHLHPANLGSGAAVSGYPCRCCGLGRPAVHGRWGFTLPEAATLFSGIMAGAVRDQRIPRNPCEGVGLPRLPPHEQRFLTLPQLQLLADCAGEYRTMVLVLGLCGLRFGECAALRVLDFEPLRRRLRVRRSVSDVNGRLVYSTTKTHEERDVPVPRFLADLLVEEVAGRMLEELIFTSPGGKPLRPGNWRRRVWDAALQPPGSNFSRRAI